MLLEFNDLLLKPANRACPWRRPEISATSKLYLRILPHTLLSHLLFKTYLVLVNQSLLIPYTIKTNMVNISN